MTVRRWLLQQMWRPGKPVRWRRWVSYMERWSKHHDVALEARYLAGGGHWAIVLFRQVDDGHYDPPPS